MTCEPIRLSNSGLFSLSKFTLFKAKYYRVYRKTTPSLRTLDTQLLNIFKVALVFSLPIQNDLIRLLLGCLRNIELR